MLENYVCIPHNEISMSVIFIFLCPLAHTLGNVICFTYHPLLSIVKDIDKTMLIKTNLEQNVMYALELGMHRLTGHKSEPICFCFLFSDDFFGKCVRVHRLLWNNSRKCHLFVSIALEMQRYLSEAQISEQPLV